MEPQTSAPSSAPKKRGPLLIILIVVGVVIVIGIAVFAWKKSDDSGSEAGAPAGQAAKGLYKAWQAGDETAAAKFANQTSVVFIFDNVKPSDANGLEFDGCTATGDDPFPKECEWSRPGGQLTMTVDKQGDKPVVTKVDYGPAGLPPDTSG